MPLLGDDSHDLRCGNVVKAAADGPLLLPLNHDVHDSQMRQIFCTLVHHFGDIVLQDDAAVSAGRNLQFSLDRKTHPQCCHRGRSEGTHASGTAMVLVFVSPKEEDDELRPVFHSLPWVGAVMRLISTSELSSGYQRVN